jgi:hypothetical protein
MHKSATKCNETVGKWCKNKHGASKIINTLETYHPPNRPSLAARLEPSRPRTASNRLRRSSSSSSSCVAARASLDPPPPCRRPRWRLPPMMAYKMSRRRQTLALPQPLSLSLYLSQSRTVTTGVLRLAAVRSHPGSNKGTRKSDSSS